jgi:hypothetical protein
MAVGESVVSFRKRANKPFYGLTPFQHQDCQANLPLLLTDPFMGFI